MAEPVTVIALLASDGSQIQRFDVTPSSTITPGQSATPPLPTTLEWYRDLSKWLVTAAAGAIAIGLTTFGESTDQWLRTIFTAAGLCLIGALTSGALLHLWVVEFGKLWENRGGLSDAAEIKANQDARDGYLKKARMAYWCLLGTFCGGLLLFGGACGWRMWTSGVKHSYVVVASGTAAEPLLIDTDTGEVWIVTTTKQGKKHWQPSMLPVNR